MTEAREALHVTSGESLSKKAIVLQGLAVVLVDPSLSYIALCSAWQTSVGNTRMMHVRVMKEACVCTDAHTDMPACNCHTCACAHGGGLGRFRMLWASVSLILAGGFLGPRHHTQPPKGFGVQELRRNPHSCDPP